MRLRRKTGAIAALLLMAMMLMTTASAFTPQCGGMGGGTSRRVRFPRGRTTAILRGTVVRGTTDNYLLGARAGQTMTVHITAKARNAVFQIYAPNGDALEGAGEMSDAKDWSGELPQSGDYTIVVGGTRGNASYTLEVTIR
ncbi:MAG TPA: hypothetical protein VGB17_11250 [Pyrinomonadaceae bacterium]|jgi:hypothetical protein